MNNITITHEDILVLLSLVQQQLKLDFSLSQIYGKRTKNYKRVQKQLIVLSLIENKLNHITSITYDKK